MDELVQLVVEKTGLSEEKSRQAVETVVGYLKENLPEPLAGQVDKVLSGAGDVDVEGLAQSLGGMLGNR